MRSTPALFALALIAACSGDDSNDCTVTSVTITGAPASIVVGANATLTATIEPGSCTGATVTWSTSNSTILGVDQTGKITGASAGGPVTITATAGGQHGTAQVSVTAPVVAAVAVVPDSIVIPIAGTFQVAGAAKTSDSVVIGGRTYTWAPVDPAIATVSPSGLVTGVTRGTASLTATTGGINGTGRVVVAAPRVVYFWNGNETPVGTENPSDEYSFNLGSGTNSITSAGTGQYQVSYSNFARTGAETEALFITSYGGASGKYCNVSGWSAASATLACFNTTGAPTNSEFDFMAVGSATFGGRFAYAWVNIATPGDPYAPSVNYRHSSSNQPITVTKTATGVYTVLFAGQGRPTAADREAIVVNGYGGGSEQCQPSTWATVGSDLSATVRCFDAAGAAIDSRFDILLVSAPRPGANLGWVDADQPSNTSAYTPTNAKVLPAGTASVKRNSAGYYSVTFNGLIRSGALKETFLVSAVGNTLIRCQSGGWGYDGTGAVADVYCTNPAGTVVDSRFVMIGVQ